ncbi:hypothetical protein BDR04DRAFT_136897 [Suillus decipiens]|nr:hypothetical protein BDR04DRAFT_136897 [Suillus decipiens]
MFQKQFIQYVRCSGNKRNHQQPASHSNILSQPKHYSVIIQYESFFCVAVLMLHGLIHVLSGQRTLGSIFLGPNPDPESPHKQFRVPADNMQ